MPAGTSSDVIAGMFDILPTLAALGGGKVPADRKIDGGNLWPILAGAPDAKPVHDHFYYYRGMKLEGVRSGDWKLRLAGAQDAKKNANAPAAPGKAMLFNLKSDIGETTDVAAANPEVVAKLEALVAAMKDDLGLDGQGPGSRALGRVERPAPILDHDGKARSDVDASEN